MQKTSQRNFSIYTLQSNTKPVPKPPAQSSALCEVGSEQLAAFERSISAILTDKLLSRELIAITEILYLSGSRISQVLSIKSDQISPAGRITIKAAKRGIDTIVMCSLSKNYLLSVKTLNCQIFSDYNRFFMYRFFKNRGLEHKFLNKSHSSVTHLFRHLAAMDMLLNNTNKDLIASQLGHVQVKTQSYYTHEKK